MKRYQRFTVLKAFNAGFMSNAWLVSFLNGVVASGGIKRDNDFVWCVRGGQGVNTQ
jgi:hypothetical protein